MIPVIDNDRIDVGLIGSVATTIRFTFRIEDAIGSIIPYAEEVTSTTDRLLNLETIVPIKRGKLLSGMASIVSGTVPKSGELYAFAEVINQAVIREAQILGGYVYTANAPSFPAGRVMGSEEGRGSIVSNEADSTLVNNTALTRTITVPANARWKLYGGDVLNGDDVSRNLSVAVDDGTDRIFTYVVGSALGVSARHAYPFDTGGSITELSAIGPVPLVAGDRVRITWAAGGASAGGTAKSSANIEEWIGL